MGVVKVKSITLEDGRLTRSESGWVYTGAGGTFTGSTPSEALAKAYNVNDAEVKVLRFKDYGVKALVCIEGLCELYDVEYEEGGSRG